MFCRLLRVSRPLGARTFAAAPRPIIVPSSQPENRFLAKVQTGEPIICAEGYLFEMERRGYVQFGPFVPEVSLSHPEAVRQLHLEFVRAGSDIVEAFTYYANRAKMRLIGKEDVLEPLNRAALRIARQVADETGTIMAGNICNTTSYSPTDPQSWELARAMFKEQVQWAAEEGAELVIGETFDYLGEAEIALEEIKKSGLPPVITFALANWTDGSKLGDKLLLQDGVPIVDACKKMYDQGAVVVGLNCHLGPQTIIPPMEALRKGGCGFPLAALPVGYNCPQAKPTMQELSESGKTYTDLDTFTSTRYDFASFGEDCKRLGIQYVGTCCGAAPHHVRALAMAMGKSPESGKYVPDLTKHFVFGTKETLEAVGNLQGSFLHKHGK
jgi:betaine-homocysteine S-methyltransferase